MNKPLNKPADPAQDADAQATSAPSAHALLGDAEMDANHEEFVALAQSVAKAPAEQLAPAMDELFQHTQAHFSAEEVRMQSLNDPLLPEHRAEHQRILGDMDRFNQRVRSGRGAMARVWVRENLLDWFSVHVRTMDSALVSKSESVDSEDSSAPSMAADGEIS